MDNTWDFGSENEYDSSSGGSSGNEEDPSITTNQLRQPSSLSPHLPTSSLWRPRGISTTPPLVLTSMPLYAIAQQHPMRFPLSATPTVRPGPRPPLGPRPLVGLTSTVSTSPDLVTGSDEVKGESDGWESEGEALPTDQSDARKSEDSLMYASHLSSLKKLWLSHKTLPSPEVRSEIKDTLRQCLFPYHFLVYVVRHSGRGGLKGQHCLPRAVMGQFAEIVKMDQNLKSVPSECQQQVLYLIPTLLPHYIDDIIKVFHLPEAPLPDRVDAVRCTLSSGEAFKEAALYAMKLQVREHFTVSDILVPLLSVDKMNVIEWYLSGQPLLQTEFVRLLDSLCSKGSVLTDHTHP